MAVGESTEDERSPGVPKARGLVHSLGRYAGPTLARLDVAMRTLSIRIGFPRECRAVPCLLRRRARGCWHDRDLNSLNSLHSGWEPQRLFRRCVRREREVRAGPLAIEIDQPTPTKTSTPVPQVRRDCLRGSSSWNVEAVQRSHSSRRGLGTGRDMAVAQVCDVGEG